MSIAIDKLGERELDILKELGNIGAGNAATALSQILAKKV
ncbi:MAG: CheC-like family, partial [Fusobacteriaceae bacterium]|nr:CheC-like family [Fusobacteriaceae bacterium]